MNTISSKFCSRVTKQQKIFLLILGLTKNMTFSTSIFSFNYIFYLWICFSSPKERERFTAEPGGIHLASASILKITSSVTFSPTLWVRYNTLRETHSISGFCGILRPVKDNRSADFQPYSARHFWIPRMHLC